MQNKWAILAGTDYVPGTAPAGGRRGEEPTTFAGCVRDVEKMSSYLQAEFAFPSSNIHSFVSNVPFVCWAPENTEHLPATYDNVVNAFQRLRTEAKAGDVLYVQFSGAFVLAERILALDYHRGRPFEECFILLGNDGYRKYLYSLELAVLLDKLGKNGLDITVILDKRTLRSTTDVNSTLPKSKFTQHELSGVFHGLWCPEKFDTQQTNPDLKFPFVLAAQHLGGPFTDAMVEVKDQETHEYHGFLTSWLLKLLQSHGVHLTWNDIFRQLDILIKNQKGPDRSSETNFEFHGNTERLFLQGIEGRKRLVSLLRFTARLLTNTDGFFLELQCGRAHGLHPGMIFKFEPFHIEMWVDSSMRAALIGAWFEVARTTEFSSLARPSQSQLSRKDISDEDIGREVSGYATLMDRKYYGFYPQSKAHQVEIYKSRLRLLGNSQELYENMHARIVGGFRYPKEGFRIDESIPTISKNGSLHLLNGDYVTIGLSELTKEDVYIHALYFDGALGVTQVLPKTYQSTLSMLLPRGPGIFPGVTSSDVTIDFRLLLSLPEAAMGSSSVNTYIKIIVANKPTSFHSLELPTVEDRDFLTNLTNTCLSPCTSMSDRIEDLQQTSLTNTREELRGSEKDAQSDAWACFNLAFVIHTTRESLAKAMSADQNI